MVLALSVGSFFAIPLFDDLLVREFAQCCPFRFAWGAVSFPLAACAIASLRIAVAFPSRIKDVVALSILAAAGAVIGWLTIRTSIGIVRGELRQLA